MIRNLPDPSGYIKEFHLFHLTQKIKMIIITLVFQNEMSFLPNQIEDF